MIRTFISVMRAKMVGPNLSRLSEMKPTEVSNMMLLCSEDPVLEVITGESTAKRRRGAGLSQNSSGSSASQDELLSHLDSLKAHLGSLSERVEVLERLTYRQAAEGSLSPRPSSIRERVSMERP
jgi:hypothetical protein